MSGNGALRARLEAERKERIRLETVRVECIELVNTLQKQIDNVSTGIKQNAKTEIDTFARKLNTMKNNIQDLPDSTLVSIKGVMNELASIIVIGEANMKNWEQGRQDWEKELLLTRMEIESLKDSRFKIAKAKYKELAPLLEQISEQGFETGDISNLKNIQKVVKETRERIEGEAQTRELVKSITQILVNKGFVPSKPKYSKEKDNTIEMLGTLDSGRSVKFWINPDGNIDFNFDGFVGTSCKDSIDEMAVMLSDSGVESEVSQFNWHNPDKLEKGSKDIPRGGQTRSRTQ